MKRTITAAITGTLAALLVMGCYAGLESVEEEDLDHAAAAASGSSSASTCTSSSAAPSSTAAPSSSAPAPAPSGSNFASDGHSPCVESTQEWITAAEQAGYTRPAGLSCSGCCTSGTCQLSASPSFIATQAKDENGNTLYYVRNCECK